MADIKPKTLLCLLQGIRGRETTIDLRNEVIVKGTISDVDKKMNLTLTGVTYRLLSGVEHEFDQLFIQGSQIRYVHIPDDVNVASVIKEQAESSSGQRPVLYSKQVLTSTKRKRYEEEKQMVREYVLGRGRAKNTATSLPSTLPLPSSPLPTTSSSEDKAQDNKREQSNSLPVLP